jgi:protocatechuate 3,4-dioxygenase beta subunit
LGLVAVLAAAPVLAAQQRPSPMPPGTGSISGRVVAGDTGRPLRNALVEIVIYGTPSGDSLLSGRFGQATTDAQGKFTFDKLPAGRFQIAAQAASYIRMQYGQLQPGSPTNSNMPRTIDLADGQAFTAADFTLTHFNAIEGVVTDEFGDPAPNVSVQVSQVLFAGGRHRLVPVNASTDAGPARPTDDTGHFRIAGLPPGNYYVEALAGAFVDPSAAGGFAVTYFPGTTETAAARLVTLAPGQDAKDVSFALTPAPTVLVAGTVVNGEDKPIGAADLILMPAVTNGPQLFATVRSVAGPDGQFAFRNVPPGSYTIQVFGAPVSDVGNLGARPFGYLTFHVGDPIDTGHLTVRVPGPRALRGHVTFEANATTPLPQPAAVRISALPVDFESAPMAGGPAPFTVHDDWRFEVLAMSGLRALSAGAPGWWLKSVTVDGQDVTDSPLDFREQDVTGVELVFTTRTTTLTATLAVPKDHVVADYNVLVFAAEDTKWTLWSRYVVLLRPNQQSAFVTKGLPPGQYYAIPVGALTGGEWQDPEYLRALLTSGEATPFSLSEGESKTVPLTARR